MQRILVYGLIVGLVTAGVTPVAGPATSGDAIDMDGVASTTEHRAVQPTDNSTQITVLSYNDIQTASAKDTRLPRFVTVLNQRREAHDNPTVVVGGGDQIAPHALGVVSQWRLPVEILNTIGTDVEVVGNHELDYGLAPLSNVTNASSFPWLAANLVDNSTGEPIDGTEAFHVTERDGVRIGYVGVVSEAVRSKVPINFTQSGVRIADPTETAIETARMLKEERNVDVVITSAHAGIGGARDIANQGDYTDVIVAGDDEVRFPPTEVSGTIITEAQARAQYLSEINLTVTNGTVTDWEGRLLNVTNETAKNETVSDLITEYRSEAALDSVVVQTAVPLDARAGANFEGETGLGNLVTDAMRNATGADVAITNAGGIRSNRLYSAGNITGGDVFSILPFSNTVLTVNLTGQELKETLASQIRVVNGTPGVGQQVSGISFEWNASADSVDREVQNVTVGGEPLRENATYEVAINSFMATGGDGYPLANEPAVQRTDELLATVVIDYLEQRETISPETEGRMVYVGSQRNETTETTTRVKKSSLPFMIGHASA